MRFIYWGIAVGGLIIIFYRRVFWNIWRRLRQCIKNTENIAQPNQYRDKFKRVQNKPLTPGQKIIVALDLGSTYSGYAYSTRNFVDSIELNDDWRTEYGTTTTKTNSFILTKKDTPSCLIEHGYYAYHTYSRSPDAAKHYSLYHNVKGALFKTNGDADDRLTEDQITDPLLIDILTANFRYFNEHLRYHLFGDWKSTGGVTIKWIVPVPDSCSDKQINTLKRAAFEAEMIADLNSDNWSVVNESFAAAIWCQQCPLSMVSGRGPNRISQNERYIVINAGGRHVGVTTFQNDSDGPTIIKQEKPLHQNWNTIFKRLFVDAFGVDMVTKYRNEYPQDWIFMWSKFELIKHTFDTDDVEDEYTLEIPSTFVNFVEKKNRKSIIGVLKKKCEVRGNYTERLKSEYEFGYRKGELFIPGQYIADIFNQIVSDTNNELLNHFGAEGGHTVRNIFVVGGFSDLIATAIRKDLGPDYNVINNLYTNSSVLKGSVLYGQRM